MITDFVKSKRKEFGLAFLNIFLLLFMILIFGPAEIFFTNVSEFEFKYGEFAGYLAMVAIGISLILGVLFSLFNKFLYKIFMSVVFGVSVAGYLQVMFLNQKLDMLGLNPEGYQVSKALAVGNLCIWLAIIAIILVFAFRKENIWKTTIKYAASFLLCIQFVAYLSLLLTARDEAFHYPEGDWHLTGENQFVVSANENVIVIILDYFSNQDLLKVKETYPDYGQNLKDFTYYSNVDCNYYGTYPSITHMLTGKKVDPSMPVNDWFNQVWTDPDTIGFYEMLREKNYVTNVYTQDLKFICGTNDASILCDSFSNMADSSRDIDIFYKLLFKTMAKMSCYRMAPEAAKNVFYSSGGEYANIVTYKEDKVIHENFEFYDCLTGPGLTVDENSNYFVVHHLFGLHDFDVDVNCELDFSATLEDTAMGCMVMVEEYLEQLRALGVYDNSTIIITADHGDFVDSQVIYYIKEKGVQKDKLQETNAPISHAEFRATIAEAVGAEDYSVYGQSVHEFKEDEQRERTVWIRGYDDKYPEVPNFIEDRNGYTNHYKSYKYTGDYNELLDKINREEYEAILTVDSFF